MSPYLLYSLTLNTFYAYVQLRFIMYVSYVLLDMSTSSYARCPNCNKSNPIENIQLKEQTCIFCGQPFTIPDESVTQLITEVQKTSNINRIPKTKPVKEPMDRNMTKPER